MDHIWINAFGTIDPTQEFLTKIGRKVLSMLDKTEYTDEFGLSPMVVLTINKS